MNLSYISAYGKLFVDYNYNSSFKNGSICIKWTIGEDSAPYDSCSKGRGEASPIVTFRTMLDLSYYYIIGPLLLYILPG